MPKIKDLSHIDAFFFGPVRNRDSIDESAMSACLSMLEKNGLNVHYPSRNTDQNGNALKICWTNFSAIFHAPSIYDRNNRGSTGSKFDRVMTYVLLQNGYEKYPYDVDDNGIPNATDIKTMLDEK